MTRLFLSGGQFIDGTGREPAPNPGIVTSATRVAGFKAPRSLDVVGELPVSAAGKVLKSALRERYWAGEQRGAH